MSILDRLTRWMGRAPQAPQARHVPQPAPLQPTVPVAPPEPAAAPAAEVVEARAPAAVVVTAPVAVPPPGIKERRQNDRMPAGEGVRVLVVDDSPTIVLMLSRMLEQNGYEVSEAGDAEAGMEIARNTQPHIIFLDIVLPGMNGFEALRRLRRDPVTRTTPVIMISGNELATEQFYAQRIGADDFMKKPFSRSEVFLRVEKLLGPDRIPKPHVTPASR